MLHGLKRRGQELWLKSKSQWLKYPLKATEYANSYSPFFIMGSGRSGTTLLRKLLEQNEQIIIPPESGGLIEQSIKSYIKFNSWPWDQVVENILSVWERNPDFKYWNLASPLSRQSLCDLPEDKRSLQAIIKHIYELYAQQYKPQAYLWGDKSPYATLGLAWILMLYPRSLIINMLRDGRDVVNSFLKHGIYQNLGDACDRWNRSVDIMQKHQQSAKIITIRYEELVRQPEIELRRLQPYFPVQFLYQAELRPVHLGDDHLPHHSNLIKPISTNAIGSWKRELSSAQRSAILKRIGPNLKRMGYVA